MSLCTQCGACCASYSVDFSVAELLSAGGRVPDGLTVEVTAHTARMRGTDHTRPRCCALGGQVGVAVKCQIYEWRPNPCDEFGIGSPACQRARARHGLAPLPEDQIWL